MAKEKPKTSAKKKLSEKEKRKGASKKKSPLKGSFAKGLAKIVKKRAKGKYTPTHFPNTQRVTSEADLKKLTFTDDMAEIEVPIEFLDLVPFRNEERGDSERLREVERQIRYNGYNNMEPVVVTLGQNDRWVIIDGGHRVTAAKKISREFFTNLFNRKVNSLHFTLHRTPLSKEELKEKKANKKGKESAQTAR